MVVGGMVERGKNSARDYTDAEKVLKSAIVKRFHERITDKRNLYRENCKHGEGAKLHKDQGKWEALDIVLPLLGKILKEMKIEATGSI